MAKGLAIVTGASGGLGLQFARLLAADGWDLALVARSQDKLETLATALRLEFGVKTDVVVEDLAVLGAADRLFARIPSCDVLVNNAGFATNAPFASIPEERVTEELLLNVVTLTLLTRKYLPGMIERKSGRVLNVASTAAFLPGPFMAAYYAAKAYVLSFSEALWEELRGSGVTVTCLCPGATETGFQSRANIDTAPLFNTMPVANANDVAAAGYRAMMRGKRLEIPGFLSQAMIASLRTAPRGLALKLSRKLAEQ
ncbi:MAG: SDR family NAD(P)-dependent oxidoreductase [Vulcanimicrobiaceae bacterium]